MNLHDRLRSVLEYGRDLVDSGLEGASCGRDEFLQGEALAPQLNDATRKALQLVTAGACVGMLGSCLSRDRKAVLRKLAFGALGVALGLGASLTWRTHALAANVARGALRSVGAVRDAHWLESHPIDYA